MTMFWEKILQYDKSFLEDPKGLALVFWCSYGKQRSTAVAAVLRYCMERSGWNLFGNANTFSSKPEISLLSYEVYEKGSCGVCKCPHCDDLISGRTGCELQTAYDIWCEITTKFMNKRGRRHRTWRLISPCCMLGWAPIVYFLSGLSPGSVLAVCWAEPQCIVMLGCATMYCCGTIVGGGSATLELSIYDSRDLNHTIAIYIKNNNTKICI